MTASLSRCAALSVAKRHDGRWDLCQGSGALIRFEKMDLARQRRIAHGLSAGALFLAIAGPVLGTSVGCTDRSLYGTEGQEPNLPDKIALEGVLCTDNPATRQFPVKILFIVDSSGPMRDTAPFGEHVDAMNQIIQQFLPIANVFVGVIRYDNRAEQLIVEQNGRMTSGFSRDDAQIEAAMANLRNGAGARDLAGAMSLARSIVTGDAFQAARGPLSRTKYVVVHVTSGSPAPPIASFRCDDLFQSPPDVCEIAFFEKQVRDVRDAVLELGAAEFAFHTVFIEAPIVEGAICDPRSGNEQCETGFTCVRIGGRVNSGRCAELCDSANPACTLDPQRPICATTSLPDRTTIDYCARAELNCFDGVDNDRDGNDRDCADPDYPYGCSGSGGCETDCRSSCRAERLGIAMSLGTGGRYERIPYADQTNFSRIDFRSTQRPFVLKELLVSNRSAIPTDEGFVIDSDADGLSDTEEALLGLNPLERDSDGDAYGDHMEHLLRTLGMDPQIFTTLPDCEDRSVDGDGDGLTDCEEKLLGTDRTLFDTDADGFPDLVELVAGTNALFNDNLDDVDIDGVPNGLEIRGHTDVTSNDARVRGELAYQYQVTDLGIGQNERTCYAVRVSNVTLVATQDRGFGAGNNDVVVYFGQVPEGALGSFGIYYVAQLRVTYAPPEQPAVPTLDLQSGDFVFFEQ